MAGIKIVTILKDDTFQDILELFRRSDASEVIFVLPKNGKVFRTEDHFAAFASEAATGNKVISMLAAGPTTASLARKYGFTVMSSGKATPVKPVKEKKGKAVLATVPPPMDPDIQDESQDAFDEDVVVPGGEQDNIQQPGASDETEEEQEAEEVPAVRSAAQADMDYIDEMWRRKAAQGKPAPEKEFPVAVRPARVHRSTAKPLVLAILAGSIAVLGMTVYLTTGSATAIITPVAQDLDTQVTIQASDIFSAIDPNFNKLPGQLYEVTDSASQEATGTGQRDVASKARGTVTITNAFSSSPQTLIATTRLATPAGLIFRTLQTVTVPGNGTVQVQVVADKPGEQYNIPAGSFTFPAFKERGDTERYAKFTAQSALAFSGGANGPSAVVTQTDFDTAKAAAIKAVSDKIKAAFAQHTNGMMVLDTIEPTVTKVESTAQPDDAAAKFTVTATATLRTVAFRKADLFDLLTQAIMKKEHLTVLPDKLQLEYQDIAFKSDTGVLVFTIAAKGTGYQPIDEQSVATAIRGMNSAKIHTYFADQKAEIASATVSLSPFWVRSVPTDPAKVHLKIQYGLQP